MKKKTIVTFVVALSALAIIAATTLYQRGDEVSAEVGASRQASQALQAEPLTTGNFLLEISGIASAGGWWFLDGVDINLDVVIVREGGASTEFKVPGDVPHFSPDGIVVRGPFLASRQDMRDWFNSTVQGNVDRRTGSLVILDRDQNEAMRFNLFRVWPSNYRLTSLGAAQVLGCSNCPDTILQEEFVLQVEGITLELAGQ